MLDRCVDKNVRLCVRVCTIIEFRLVCDDVKFFFKSDFEVAGGFVQYFGDRIIK